MATSAAAAKSTGVASTGVARPKRKTREERIDAALRATARAAAAQLAREGLTLPVAPWTGAALVQGQKQREGSGLAAIARKEHARKIVKIPLTKP